MEFGYEVGLKEVFFFHWFVLGVLMLSFTSFACMVILQNSY